MGVFKRGEYWYIDFTFKGKRIKKSIGPSRQGAEKIISKYKAEIAENKFLDKRYEPPPIKFHDFSKEYLEWSRANNKPSSARNKLYCLRMLDKEFGNKNLSDITAWQIEKWKKDRKGMQSRRNKPIGPYEVNRELATLKHLFSKAVEWNKVKENPAKKVKLLKGEEKRVRFLSFDEIQTLFENCEGPLRDAVEVALNTGMRKGEIFSVDWDHVNLDHGIMSVIDSKNRERRDVPINKTVRAILERMEKREGPVFDKKNLRKSFEAAVKKSGIQNFRFHDLRHSFASILAMEGQDLSTIGELLGHKTPGMTKRYAHLSRKYKTRVVEILDRVLKPSQNQHQKKVK